MKAKPQFAPSLRDGKTHFTSRKLRQITSGSVSTYPEPSIRILHSRSIFGKLPKPWCLLPEEVLQECRTHLTVPPEKFDEHYARFIQGIFARCIKYDPSYDLIDNMVAHALSGTHPRRRHFLYKPTIRRVHFCKCSREVLFVGGQNFVVDCSTTVHHHAAHGANLRHKPHELQRLHFSMSCTGWSSAAFKHASQEVFFTIKCGVRTLEALNIVCGDDSQYESYDVDLFRWMLNAHWPQPPTFSENTLLSRARMAIHYIRSADDAKDKASRVVLCFAAIESLLPRSSTTTEQIARCMAAMLQPDPQRVELTRRHIKRLYAARSDIVHGRDASAQDCAGEARLLAGAALLALHSWWSELRRTRLETGGDQASLPSESDWFDELKECAESKQQISGVPDTLAKCLLLDG